MQTQSNDPISESDGFVFITALISENKESLSACIFLDSGASEHLVNDVNLFLNVTKLEKPVSIKVAKSGSILYSTKVGDIRVRVGVRVKDTVVPITLKNVL